MSTDSERKYLMIENPGHASIELLVVRGASGSRGRVDRIGQFGSGTPESIALSLRKDLRLTIFSSKDGYRFDTEKTYGERADGALVPIYNVVMQKIGSTRTTKLGFDVSAGGFHWQDSGMVVREFLSNAVDAVNDTTKNYSDIRTAYVTEADLKGREGYTRVFMLIDDEVQDYLDKIKSNFLVLNQDYDPSQVFLEKAPKDPLRIYRKGVLVYEDHDGRPSLYNYNFQDIRVNEDRTIAEHDARAWVSHALKYAAPDQIISWFKAIRDHKNVFEVTAIDNYRLQVSSSDSDEAAARVRTYWSAAFRAVYGDKGVVVDSGYGEKGVQNKGYTPARVPTACRAALASYGLTLAETILSPDERVGRETFPLPRKAAERMVTVWEILVECGLHNGREMPALLGFKTMMGGHGTKQALYDPSDDRVLMSADVYEDEGVSFYAATIEEFGHAITQAADETRVFQDWAFRATAEVMRCLLACRAKSARSTRKVKD